jgi:hypothetical protein
MRKEYVKLDCVVLHNFCKFCNRRILTVALRSTEDLCIELSKKTTPLCAKHALANEPHVWLNASDWEHFLDDAQH